MPRLSPRTRIAIVIAATFTTAAALVLGVSTGRLHLPGLGQPAAGQSPAETWVCPMHPDVRQTRPGRCPLCGMELERTDASADAGAHQEAHGAHAVAANPERPGVAAPPADTAEARAPFTIDGRRQQLVGVRVVPVEETSLARTVRAVGQVREDESRWTDVNVRFEGWIRELYVDRTGQVVRAGQPLFALYSPDLATALAEYALAERTRASLGATASAGARAEADRLTAATRRRLERLDAPADAIDSAASPSAGAVTVFRAPASGVVMEKRAVSGQRVMPGESLYRLLDLSVVWVEADVFEADLPFVKVGQRGTITVDAAPGEPLAGRVTFISPTLEAQTRTARVRFEVANSGGRLKPGMFATAELPVRLGSGLTVPTDAVVDSGNRRVVFVAEGDGYFEPREVVTGHRTDGRIQVVRGLAAGDRVAAGATFFLDSESQMRAALQGYATPAPATGGEAAGRATSSLRIDLRTVPDPPRAGDATVEVRVAAADGAPVTDAAVTVTLYMPPMPSMNMPAMRTEASLTHTGNGLYRGTANVTMSGRWEATVTVSRGGATIGSRQVALLAR